MQLRLKDIEITQKDRIDILKIWEEHKIITRNLDNIIKDFDFINQNVEYELEENEETMQVIKNDKLNWINSHICGVVCTLAPDSNFNSKHVTENGKLKKENETSDFAKSLKL